MIGQPNTAAERNELIEQSVTAALVLFDAASREYAYHRYQEMLRETGGISPSVDEPVSRAGSPVVPTWQRHVERVDEELLTRAAPLFTRLVMEQLLDRCQIIDSGGRGLSRGSRTRAGRGNRGRDAATCSPSGRPAIIMGQTRGPGLDRSLEPHPILDAILDTQSKRFSRRLMLWKADRGRAGGLRRRARHGRSDAGLDQRLDDAHPESSRHAFDRASTRRSASACWAGTWTTSSAARKRWPAW